MTYLFTINWTLLLLATILPMTHSFYLVLRIVICGTTILYAVKVIKAHKIYDFAEYVILALILVIYNPIFPFHKNEYFWITMNILTAIYLTHMKNELKDIK